MKRSMILFLIFGFCFMNAAILRADTRIGSGRIGSGCLNCGAADPCAGKSIGQACTGGALYAGTWSGFKYMTTPSGCTNWANATDEFSPTCAGGNDTVTKKWAANDGRTPTANEVSTGATATDNGITNTTTLEANYADTDAAKYCAHMVYGGYSDWYLPSGYSGTFGCTDSSGELYNVLYANSNRYRPGNNAGCTAAVVAGPLGGFVSVLYWSSTEQDAYFTRNLDFSSGYQGYFFKGDDRYVRCVRRYS